MHDLDKQAVRDAREMAELLAMPGWKDMVLDWEALIASAFLKRANMTPEELAKARAEVGVLRILEALPEAIAKRGAEVMFAERIQRSTPQAAQATRGPKQVTAGFLVSQIGPVAKPKWDEESAIAAAKRAENVEQITKHPAWGRLMAILAALRYAFDEALKVGGIVDDAACQAVLSAIPAPALRAQRLVRAGVNARAFLNDQVVGKQKERQDA